MRRRTPTDTAKVAPLLCACAVAALAGLALREWRAPGPIEHEHNYAQIPELLTPAESSDLERAIIQEQIAGKPAHKIDPIELARARTRIVWNGSLAKAEKYLEWKGLPQTEPNRTFLQDVIDGLNESLRTPKDKMTWALHGYMLSKVETGDYYLLAEGEEPPPWNGSWSQITTMGQGPLAGETLYISCWPVESAEVDAAYYELLEAWDYAYDELRVKLAELPQ